MTPSGASSAWRPATGSSCCPAPGASSSGGSTTRSRSPACSRRRSSACTWSSSSTPRRRTKARTGRSSRASAAAGGFAPPPVTVVQTVDLYRLLAAADAHLGIHSTLLTEAVATGTPNLLAAGLAGADLLGYVEAGVAVPVRTAADIAAVLDRPREEVVRAEDREAFLRAHFEPGDASRRIADGLLAWMGGGTGAEGRPG